MRSFRYLLITIIVGSLAGFGGSWLFFYATGQQQDHDNAKTYRKAKEQFNERFKQKTDSYQVRHTGQNGAHVKRGVRQDFVTACEKSTPSVVYVKTMTSSEQTYNWFDYFFHDRGNTRQVISSGSGVIFSEDGYIITNNHVVNKADEIQVVHGKKKYKAELIGGDPSTDIAVLKIDAEELPVITVGNSADLKVGEWVLAVGNPFNLTSTVTAGIVSAKERNINILDSRFPIESFIQTDAAINPGNSGGALVNNEGELMGINTAILSKTGSYAGYGFAVPVNIVQKVVKDIIEYGSVQKAYFGADVMEMNEKISEKIDVESLDGVLISYILDGGAAAKAGLAKGDVILEINGKKINSKADFNEQLSYYRPGNKIKVKYLHDGTIREISLTLLNEQGTTELIEKHVHKSETLGAELEEVPRVESERLGIEGGVRVVNINRGLLRRLNITEGFIITAVNNKKIKKPEELEQVLSKLKGSVVIQGINKDGRRTYRSFYIR